jgi:signal transduction histidine kinase
MYLRLAQASESEARPPTETGLRLSDEVCLSRVTDDMNVEIARTIEGQSGSGDVTIELEDAMHERDKQDSVSPWPCDSSPAGGDVDHVEESSDVNAMRVALSLERAERRRAECLANIQSGAVQLALDLLVREPDMDGFFGKFTTALAEECESLACGVWLIDEDQRGAHLWMAYVHNRLFTRDKPDWDTLALPRIGMATHLFAHRPGWTHTVEYAGDDPRLPETVRTFNRELGVHSLAVAPLVLATRTLGWVALSNGESSMCEGEWRMALLDAVSRQATLALHQSQQAERSRYEERRKAILEERNRLARDIHDVLAQGFAAILMQLQAAQRESSTLPQAVASKLEAAVELARSHMVEARRSVSALRPIAGESDELSIALKRLVEMARRTTEVPIDLVVDELPRYGDAVERDMTGIIQEALTNAVRHARARRITVRGSAVGSIGLRLSVADDGRGIPRDQRSTGFGMTSMQERAERIGASLTVVTAPRSGTEVVVAWQPASQPAEVYVRAHS